MGYLFSTLRFLLLSSSFMVCPQTTKNFTTDPNTANTKNCLKLQLNRYFIALWYYCLQDIVTEFLLVCYYTITVKILGVFIKERMRSITVFQNACHFKAGSSRIERKSIVF